MHFSEGHGIITKPLIMLKIALMNPVARYYWKPSLWRETFSSSKSFTLGDFYSIGSVV